MNPSSIYLAYIMQECQQRCGCATEGMVTL